MAVDTLSLATLGVLDSGGSFDTYSMATLGYNVEIQIEEVETVTGGGGGSSGAYKSKKQTQDKPVDKVSKITIKLNKGDEYYEFTKYKKDVGINVRDIQLDIIKIDNIVVDVDVVIR